MTAKMNRVDVMKALKKNITNEIVVSTYSCALDWIAQGERELNYFSHGAMGLASSHGLGLALGRPERKVVVLDGDGSLLMNLGTLVSIAGQAPGNLIVICFQNDAYEANGGHPIPQANTVDFPGIARSAGIPNSSSIQDLAEFERRLPDILKAAGPTFVNLHIAQGPSRAGGGYEHLYTEARREALRQALANGA
jgi:sulfopyruvate decarboxylase subunit beta